MMLVTVEGEPHTFWPTVPCCPENCVTGQLIEAIFGINKCQSLWSIHTFYPLIPLCFAPMLRHLHWVWVVLKHAAKLEQFQHLAGLLNGDDHLCCWQAFGLREESDGAVVWG
jgi:hypothetical protein